MINNFNSLPGNSSRLFSLRVIIWGFVLFGGAVMSLTSLLSLHFEIWASLVTLSGSLGQRLLLLCVGTGSRRMTEVQECEPVAKDWGPLTVGARAYGW